MKMSTSIQESKSSTWSSTWSFPLPQLGSASGWKPAAEKGKWLLALVLGGTWLLCFSTCQLISDLYTVRVDKMKENIFNHNLLSLSGLGRYLILLCVCGGRGVFLCTWVENSISEDHFPENLLALPLVSLLWLVVPMIITWDLSLTSRIHILAAGDTLLTQVDGLNRTQENLTLPLSLLWGPPMVHSSPQQTLGIQTSFL